MKSVADGQDMVDVEESGKKRNGIDKEGTIVGLKKRRMKTHMIGALCTAVTSPLPFSEA